MPICKYSTIASRLSCTAGHITRRFLLYVEQHNISRRHLFCVEQHTISRRLLLCVLQHTISRRHLFCVEQHTISRRLMVCVEHKPSVGTSCSMCCSTPFAGASCCVGQHTISRCFLLCEHTISRCFLLCGTAHHQQAPPAKLSVRTEIVMHIEIIRAGRQTMLITWCAVVIMRWCLLCYRKNYCLHQVQGLKVKQWVTVAGHYGGSL